MNEKIEKGGKDYRHAIISLYLGGIVCFGSEYCVQPIIPVLAESFSLTPAQGSLAVSFGTLGMSIAMLFIAIYAKKFPRKAVMAGSLFFAAILAIFIAFSPVFSMVLICRLVQGFLLAGFPAMAIAYINEEFSPSIIGAVVGIYISGSSVGGLIGRLGLSTLTDLFDWRHALLGLAVFYLAASILFYFFLPKERYQRPQEDGSKGKKFLHLLKNKKLICVYIIAMAALGVFVCNYNFISYVLLHEPYTLSQTLVGFIYLLFLFGSVSSAVMGRLTDRFGNGSVVLLSLGIMVMGVLLSAFSPLWCKIAGLGIMTIGFFGTHSAACGWNCKLDTADKASLSALYMLFYYLGASSFGSIGGIFLSNYGWNGIVCFCTGVLMIAFISTLYLKKIENR